MTNVDRIDRIFAAIYDMKAPFNYTEISNYFAANEPSFLVDRPLGSNNEIQIAIKKFLRDGLIEPYGSNLYMLTYEGILFFENTPKSLFGRPFKAGQTQQRLNHNWTIAKIIAAVINALVIISISIATCRISDKTRQYEDENKQLQHLVDSLNGKK